MDPLSTLSHMLRQLLEDMTVVQQQGAGYYNCASVARRYNKLLGQSRLHFTDGSTLITTFDDMSESDPKDPGDKMKVMQEMRIEINQLISLLEARQLELKGDAS
ncbi:MAG: hypothetical protein RBU21_02045 [FCB group bacterium]|jgi:hypothetical protein|nr:hypothetical protein [FCB group bacterium]